MKKVLFVATVTNHIKAFHTPYLKWFKEQGYEVHVASKGNEKIEYCDKHYNLQFERFPLKRKNLKVYRELKKIINENNYEIIHCHTPVGGVLTRLAAKKARKNGTKVIYTSHGFHFYKGAPLLNWLIYYPIEKWLSKYTDCLITINQEDYERAKKHFYGCKNIKMIHGVGINTSKFEIEITEDELEILRSEIGLNKKDIILTYVAELNSNKNQILLLRTMKELIKNNNRYKLLLVGEGNKKAEYEKYIQDNELKHNVFLLGKREDIPKILKITNIYIATSIREGLGLNVIEAMKMKLPIIATNNRGHRELINTNNMINNNIKELKDKVLNLNQEMKRYKSDVKLYEIENSLDEMMKIYKEIKS